jgi:DNA (cytosine-5)-methyltransferase 1
VSRRPLLLDLFCGAGGAAVGYHRAGFDVVGVDHRPQPRYPFEFCLADALEYLANGGWKGFDAIHASPPCQGYSSLKAIRRFGSKQYPLLIEPCRELLIATGKPYVIENVPGSTLGFSAMLCGSMFGLGAICDGAFHQLRRHRLFETSFLVLTPPCQHVGRPVGVYGNGGAHRRIKDRPGINGFTGNATESCSAMGIDWMSRYELSQAIPPAYCEFIGKQLRNALEIP